MGGRVRSPAPALVLIFLMLLVVSSSGHMMTVACGGRASRKLLPEAPQLPVSTSTQARAQQRQQQMREVDTRVEAGGKDAAKQVGASFRKIPPSGSNPTQNWLRP